LRGNARLDKGLAHGIDATLAERGVVRIGSTRIRVAVDAKDHRWIRLEVRGDVMDLCRLVAANHGLVEVEQDVLERDPRRRRGARDALRTCRPARSLRARRPHRSLRSSRPCGSGSAVELPSVLATDGTCYAAGRDDRENHKY